MSRAASGSTDGVPSADLLLLVGVDDERVAHHWADPTVPRPVGLVTKGRRGIRVAQSLQIGVVTIAPAARWDRVLALLADRLIARPPITDSQWSTRRRLIWTCSVWWAGGRGYRRLVSIEDPTSARVLAYCVARRSR